MNAAAPRRVLVVGYGSTIRSDDGLGRRVAERITAGGFDVLSSHQLDVDLAEEIKGRVAVLFVDASCDGRPGELRCRRLGTEAPQDVMTHHLTPDALLALVRQLEGTAPAGWVLSLTGSTFDLGESLSPAIEARVDLLAAIVGAAAERLARQG